MSESSSIVLEVEALCGEVVEGVADETKRRRLEELVLEYPEAKQSYIEYINLHAALGHYTAGKISSDVAPARASEVAENPNASLPEIKLPSLDLTNLNSSWVPLLGVLMILGLAGAWILGGDHFPWSEPDKLKQGSGYVAELTWLGSKGENAPNNSLLAKGGVLRIQDEDVHVRFACGAEVTLHGPAVFHIESEKLARLEYGTLEAKVPPQAIGFLIDTPASRVIDLGTEFEVTVADNGNTNINVINGEVEAEAWRPNLIGGELRRKLFEGDSLKLSPPVTESFRTDFDTPDALEVFDIVRHDPVSCLLDPAAGLLTLKTQRGTICKDKNDNNNILVVPIPDCDFEAVLKVNRFEPTRIANHVSLATLDNQDNVYRISYWFSCHDAKRSFASTKEENTEHGFVLNAEGLEDTFFDMEDRPFRLRIERKGDTIFTYWGEASGAWIPSGEMSCKFKPRFVGFFATNPEMDRGQNEEFIDCEIDSFELKLVTPER